MEKPINIDASVINKQAAGNAINIYFETALKEYFITIDNGTEVYKGEGYAIIGNDTLSVFNDKMEPVFAIEISKALSATVNGFNGDDISMLFEGDVFVNAEK